MWKNKDKYCFLWSNLAYLHPCENSHPSEVRNFIQKIVEINIEVFEFSNGFKCVDVHKFEKPNIVSVKKIELNFYHNQNKWKHMLIPRDLKK